MAVVVARMVAQLEAETTQFHARMTAAETQLGRWGNSTRVGQRATLVLNNAIQQLAFQASSIPGPLGKAGAAIGALGVGGGPIMLAVAALGALAVAFNRAAEAAKEMEETNRRVRDFHVQHTQMLAGVGPGMQLTPAERLAQMREQRASAIALQRNLRFTSLGVDPLTGGVGALRTSVGTDPTLVTREAERRLQTVTGEIKEFDRAIAALEITVADGRRAARLAEIQSDQLTISLERGGVFQALRPQFVAPEFGASHQPGPSPTTFNSIRRNAPRFVPGEAAQSGFKFTPEFAAMSAMALAQGAQGGAGAFLGAAAAPLGMINPLAGLISGGLSTVFSLFDKSEERRHKKLIQTIERQGQLVLEKTSRVFVVDGRTGAIEELRRADDHDAVTRVQDYAGISG